MSMITALSWVPRGYPAQFPRRHELNEEEFGRISKLAKLQLSHARDDLQDVNSETEEHADGGVAVSKING